MHAISPKDHCGRRIRTLLLAVLVSALLLAGCSEADGELSARPPAPAGAPNFVVVMTDDQALDTMRAMPRTRALLGGGGTSFRQALVSFPLCCPSRASFLTGQYAHNHGVRDNQAPAGGIQALDQNRTLPVWLQRGGYRTGFVGKYLNGYGKRDSGGPELVPPGWDRWVAAGGKEKTGAYDYELNEDGKLIGYGSGPADYKTTVMADRAVQFVRSSARSKRPFFLWVATSAPHTDNGLAKNAARNPLPAPGDRGTYGKVKLPRGEAFDEADVSDKLPFVRRLDRLDRSKVDRMRVTYVSQLESLIAVDRLVKRVVGQLERSGELENTIVVFTSDNGFLRGQHRIDSGKSKLFDESVRVPLLVRGPGFPAGRIVDAPVANIDLTRTIADLSGTDPGLDLDGAPLLDAVEGRGHDRSVLLEVFERADDRFVAVRNRRYVYADRKGAPAELYDHRHDPREMRNVAAAPAYRAVRRRLAKRVEALRNCSGRECVSP